MMHGKLNTDRLCKVLKSIFNERNDGYEYKFTIVNKYDTDDNNSETKNNDSQ
jgi:hypothetical protein